MLGGLARLWWWLLVVDMTLVLRVRLTLELVKRLLWSQRRWWPTHEPVSASLQ